MSVGAYTSALISIYLNLPFIVSLLIGAIAAGVIGLIIGIPVLRLKVTIFVLSLLLSMKSSVLL